MAETLLSKKKKVLISFALSSALLDYREKFI